VSGSPEINVGPFSDIAFLLIIFFIVATTLSKMTGFLTDIPSGEKSDQQQDESPTVQLEDQRVVFNKEVVSMAELRKELQALKLPLKQDQSARIVLLEATGHVTYQAYFEAMSAISRAGGVVAIVKEEPKDKE
jgi:biopolymer transport protein ExbD